MTERVLIAAVQHANQDDDKFQSLLEELQSLTETAQGEVISIVTQKRSRIHPAIYMGEGKVTEIAELIEENEIDLVIFNDELSPGQINNLTKKLDRRIIDRSQLILDIFAQRARTKEGKLQVELAQLQYLLPRLYGQGVAMSRLGAGIGTRGPGETKLETDRRHIQRRIDDIKKRLNTVVNQRSQYRKRRKENKTFQIAIVGYTNAGKSTFFNRLTNSQSLEEDQLFATLDPLTRQIRLPSGFDCLITDTVGFLQNLPTTLIAAFRSTLEEVTEADFILHMTDASNPDHEQQLKTVHNLLDDLGANQIPTLMVYNKKDMLTEDFIPSHHPAVTISAYDEIDIQRTLSKIEDILKQEWTAFHTIIPAGEGGLLQKLKKNSVIAYQDFVPEKEGYEIKGYMEEDQPLWSRIKEYQTK